MLVERNTDFFYMAGLLLSGCLLAILFERRGEGGGRKNRKRGNK